MKSAPLIIVQLVHIQGPLKGEIQEFQDPAILIGRHPDCQVLFPKDLTIVSRKHARIAREGNRFKLVDQSTNGTFVNGKKVKEAFLKDGDVVLFAEGGPKVSFLTRIVDAQNAGGMPAGAPAAVTPQPPVPPYVPPEPPPQTPAPPIQKTAAPLTIQYGPTLNTFKELPVIVGRGAGADFTLNHPAVLERHAQFFFMDGRYWVKDLTGRGSITVNGLPIEAQAPLDPSDILRLSPQGPAFRFLGGGRLAELEEAPPEEAAAPAGEHGEGSPAPGPPEGRGKGGGSLLKKFWGR